MRHVIRELHRRYIPRKLKWYYRDAHSAIRGWTKAPRCSPDFLVIGAQKSGTTYLFSLLCQHPNVIPPAFKELHYFDMNFHKPRPWYHAFFPTRAIAHELATRAGGRVITGEASPYYMYHPFAASRSHRLYPNVKIIAVLRPPVERAISHYFHSRNWGHEQLPLREALAAEPERLAAELPQFYQNEFFVGKSHPHHSYVDRGHYAAQLEMWSALYGRDKVHVIDSRELIAQPQRSLDEVCRFLEIPVAPISASANTNEATRKGGVSDDVKEQLGLVFLESNERLATYCGIRF